MYLFLFECIKEGARPKNQSSFTINFRLKSFLQNL